MENVHIGATEEQNTGQRKRLKTKILSKNDLKPCRNVAERYAAEAVFTFTR